MMPEIYKGCSGNIVKVAKYLMDYSQAGKATASFDSYFRTFVKAWQKAHNLDVDGIIGEQTWTAIAENAPYVSKANKAAVYAFQISVGLSVNGSYNAATQNMIKLYQQAAGLEIDGICGKNTWLQILALKPVKHQHTINFKQNDSRWTNVIYSKSGKATGQTIGNSGCCPTSCASVIYTLKDKTVTPVELAELAVKSGYRRASGGTDAGFISYAGKQYGFRTVIETSNVSLLKHCIDSGGYAICRFKAGSWWTSCGHYSPCWSYDKSYYYVDNTISKIKIKRAIKYLSGDNKAFYLMYP